MNKKIKLAFFSECYGKHPYGGPAIRASNIAKVLRRYGVDFSVFYLNPPHGDYSVPGYEAHINTFKPDDYNVYWIGQGYNTAKKLFNMGIRPIIGSNLVPNSAAQHCLPYIDRAAENRQDHYIRMEKEWVRHLKRGKFWLAQSDFQEKEYRRLGLPWNVDVYKAPNPVDTDLFYPAKNHYHPFTISWTGKNNWAKHVPFLIEIAKALPHVNFHYFSDEENNLKFPPNLKKVLGHTNKEMPYLLRQTNIFITTAVTENQPLGVLEAMATGLPCIGFRTSGVPEVIRHGETGVTVDLGNIDHFIVEIERLLRDPKKQRYYGKNARKFIVDNFSYKACYNTYMEFLNKYVREER